MRRVLSFLLRLALLLAALCGALWFFMPWRDVAASALSLGGRLLGERGMSLSYSGVEAVEGGFTVEGLSLEGFPGLAFDSITVRPQLLASLLNLAPTCEVTFRGGAAMVGQTLSFGNGGFLLTASSSEVLLERLSTDGDFSLQGFLTIDPAQMKIGRAEAALRVPASFAGNMEMLKGFLPLEQERDGGWFLRRDRPAGRT